MRRTPLDRPWNRPLSPATADGPAMLKVVRQHIMLTIGQKVFETGLKRILALLLVVLALPSGVQHPCCCCHQAEVVATTQGDCHELMALAPIAASRHSCCRMRSTDIAVLDTDNGLQGFKSCCGMMGQRLPATANSIEMLGHHEKARTNKCIPITLVGSGSFALDESVSQVNRAPPRLRGFGSSDTYLFKRTLLI